MTSSRVECLTALAERVEAAAGPDRELDLAIIKAVGWSDDRPYKREDGWREPLNFTASLDAAMTLVPEGLSVTLYAHSDNAHCDIYAGHPSKGLLAEVEMAATPALALTAACLRALANTDTPKGGS